MFDWLTAQDKPELRTHDTKHYDHPTEAGKTICILGSANFHYFDGKEYLDIPDLPFPEGKLIETAKDAASLVDVPEWGEARIEEDGKVVRIYDKAGVSIYKFHSPAVCPADKEAFTEKVVTIAGADSLKAVSDALTPDETVKKEATKDLAPTTFVVSDGKIGFDIAEVKEPLKAYDDTDTTSTNNKDSGIASGSPTSKFGGDAGNFYVQSKASGIWRNLISFTLPSLSGTISAVALKLYLSEYGSSGGSADKVRVHQLTGHTDWAESSSTGVCWNYYTGSSAWTTAGGDFSSTIIDEGTPPSVNNWQTWYLQGGTSDNPLILSFGDAVHLLLKYDVESDGDSARKYSGYNTKECASNKPYLEITYSSGATTLTVSVSDTLSLSGAITLVRTRLSSVSDSIGLTGAATSARSIVSSVSDSIGLTGAISSARSIITSVSDSISLAGAITSARNLVASVVDSISLTEAVATVRARLLSVSDAIGLSDLISFVGAQVISVSDSIGLTGALSASRSLVASVVDSISLAGTIEAVRNRLVSVADTLNIAEAFSAIRSRMVSVADSLSLADIASAVSTAIIDAAVVSKNYVLKRLLKANYTLKKAKNFIMKFKI